MVVLRHPKISHATFRFYAMLRALAWGENKLRINVDVLATVTGLGRTSLLEHARSLRLRNALLWHCAEDVFECLFVDLSDDGSFFSANPEIPDLLNPESLKEIPKKESKKSESGKTGFEPKATVTQVCEAYERLLGYTPATMAKGETKAAKWIGERYTVAELEQVYTYYKAQPFWLDKPLTLRQLANLLPEYLLSKGRTYAAPRPPDDPAQLERDLKLKAELDALG